MSPLNNLFNRFRPIPLRSDVQSTHPGHGDPVFKKAVRLIQSEKWSKLEDLFQTLTKDRQALLLRSLFTSYKIDPESSGKWAAHSPKGDFQKSFRIISLCNQAHESRGMGRAESTTEEQFDGFRHYATKAYEAIKEVLSETPDDLHALTWTIQANFANLIDWDTQVGYYHKSKAVDPHFFPITERMLYYLTPKWFGSEKEILNFVEYETNGLPAGSVFWGLVPAAYFHIWEYDQMFKKNPDRNVLDEVQDKIEYAYDMSLGSLSYVESPFDFYLYNFFSFCFHKYNNRERAADLLYKMGGNYTLHPWYAYCDISRGAGAKDSLNKLRVSYGIAPLSDKDFV